MALKTCNARRSRNSTAGSRAIQQTLTAFAYRLIARDTVEEKVLQLQTTKRGGVDAIINQDNSLIRNLSSEDLKLPLR